MSLLQAVHRTVPRLLWGAVLATLIGCSGGSKSPVSLEAGNTATPTLGNLTGGSVVSEQRGEILSIPGGYTLEVTTSPLAATLEPWRNNAGLQGNLFDLDIENFLKADTISINGIRFDADGNVIIDYAVKHPFNAPNFANPINAANRADLGVTGRVMFLSDVAAIDLPNRRFFANAVVANTDAVLNANAFMDPGDLLATDIGGFNANVFPYRLIVDEARGGGQGNRVGVANGGNPVGNYNPANGGWQRNNIGASNNGWTGYDFLHGGQTATNQVVFSKDSVASGGVSLDVALFVKYTDPRGVPFFQNPQVRMPQQPPDIAVFAYRMPNGALDASDVSLAGLTNKTATLGAAGGSTVDLTIKVRDWDARAVETTETELDNDPDISHVNIGTSGAPVVTMSAPRLNGSPVTFTAGAQSGLPGAEIQYVGTVTNGLGTAAEGSRQVGLIRVVDPEDSAPGRNTYHFGVDPVTVAADPARATAVITYQSVYFNIPDGNTAPDCGGLAINGDGTIGIGGTFTVDLAAATDAQADTLAVTFAYTGPTNSSTSTVNLTDAQRASEDMFNPFTDVRLTSKLQPPTVDGDYTLQVTLDDGTADPVVCEDSFTVAPAMAADCGDTAINEPGPFAPPAEFTLDLSTVTDADSGNLSFRFSYTGPGSDISSDVGIAVADLGAETAFNPFTDGRLTFPLERPSVAGDYQFLVDINDGDGSTSCGPYPFTVTGAANDPPDCGTFASQFPKTIVPSATFTLNLSTVSDPEGDDLTFIFSYAGPANSTSGMVAFTSAQLGSETAFNPFTDGRIAPTLTSPTIEDDYTFTVNIDDGVNNVDCGPYNFTVEGVANMPPLCGTTGINGSGNIPIDGEFTVDLSDISDPDTADLTIGFRYTGPENSTSGTFLIAVADLGAEDLFNPFTDGRIDPNLETPGTVGDYQFYVDLDDGDNQVACGPYDFTVEGPVGPPECNAGITLSDNSFTLPELVDFTVDLSAISDPDSLEARVRIAYDGPETDATSEQTLPFPLPAAINPFTDAGFTTTLARPTTVGVYTLSAFVTDAEENETECMTVFTILPEGSASAVTDIDVEVNYTNANNNGKTLNTTDTLTITWDEDDAPQYAIYADLNPTIERSGPAWDPTTYRADLPEVTDELELIGVSATSSFTGFDIDTEDGRFIAYIVVRARETADDPGSELADSEPAFVGILWDAEINTSADPFWLYQANDPGNPATATLLNFGAFELDGLGVGWNNIELGSVGAMASMNLPVPMTLNVDRAILTGNFFTEQWAQDDGQGEVGVVVTLGLTNLIWMPAEAPGSAYNFDDPDLDAAITGVPAGIDSHESVDGTEIWNFFRYNGIAQLDTGSLSTMGFNFAGPDGTVCPGDCMGWDEIAWVYD